VKVLFTITIIDLLAVWGAFVATLVLLWDIYKWKTYGPQISFTARPNMLIYGDSRFPSDKDFISAEAVNNGDKATTITNLGFRVYRNRFDRLLGKSRINAVIGNTGLKPLPYVLEVGTVWSGLADQDKLEEKTLPKDIIIFELSLSHSNKPKKVRVRISKTKKQNTKDEQNNK